MIIQLLNGTQYDISDYGLTRLYHLIPTQEIEHSTSTVGGVGNIITGTTLGQRLITVDLLFQVSDIYDYYLLRDVINSLFVRDEAFYIIFKREPYKRWLVKLDSGFKITPAPKAGVFSVIFKTMKRYSESIATTSDIKEWDHGKWGWNDTIDWDSELKYTFATNSFVVNNLGNVAVDPREHLLEITVKGTFPSYFKLTNNTTGDIYQYNGSLTMSDTLKISGIRTLKNNVSNFKNTNKKLISLAPGVNNISVEGGTLTSIAFDFRFLNK